MGAGLIIVALAIFFGPQALQLLQGGGGGGVSTSSGYAAGSSTATDPNIGGPNDPDKELVEFVSFVLDDCQNIWREEFRKRGKTYQDAKLVLFRDAIDSACGYSSAAVGPFYCPADNKAYIDLSFYRDLSRRFGAPGDFAQAYVLAHEIGHHVQNLLGISGKVQNARRSNRAQSNQLSVLLELQADCFAGVWAHSTSRRQLLERGDIDEGLNAAAQIGDDTMQRKAGQRVQPESWTHGSSAQRQKWFHIGYKSGVMEDCDPFKGR